MAIPRIFCWLALAACTLWLWGRSEPRPFDAPFNRVRMVRDLAYQTRDGRSSRLDLLSPADDLDGRPRPVLIAVHGGSWTGGAKRDYASQFVPLVQRGVVVAVVDYRLARPSAPSWDGALLDVLAAVDWVVDGASQHRLDPTRIAILGTSAGGLLAARAGQEDPRITAVVCLSTPTSLINLAAARDLRYEPARMFLGGDARQFLERAKQASPLEHIGGAVAPILMIHGDDDLWVPVTQARELHETFAEAGVRIRLLEIAGARHGFDLQIGGPTPRDLTPDVLEFLEASWGGPSPRDEPREA